MTSQVTPQLVRDGSWVTWVTGQFTDWSDGSQNVTHFQLWLLGTEVIVKTRTLVRSLATLTCTTKLLSIQFRDRRKFAAVFVFANFYRAPPNIVVAALWAI